MEQLYAELVNQNWPRALALALAEWRRNRAPELADLIDHIDARIHVVYPDEPQALHTWWREHARAPATTMVGGLLVLLRDRVDQLDDSAANVRARWAKAKPSAFQKALSNPQVWPSNFHERFALMQDWPADPRIARALVDIVARQPPRSWNFPELHDLIADRIGEVGDRRVLPALEQIVREPRAGSEPERQRQVSIAMRAIASIGSHAMPHAPPARLADCLALVARPSIEPPPPKLDVEPLWQVVCANPDDIGARSVLGDALIELGDPRGDVIVLQCNSRTPGRPLRGRRIPAVDGKGGHDGRVKTLIRTHWHKWFGDVGLVIVRRGSEFRCGLLEVARIGNVTTPSWAFAKAAAHRELCAVHTVRPAWVSPADFATFVASLPRFPHTLGVDHPAVFDHLEKRGTDLSPLRRLEIIRNPVTDNRRNLPHGWDVQPLATSILQIAKLSPGLRELHITDPGIARELPNLGPRLRTHFPQLERATLSRAVVGTGYVHGATGFEVVD